MYGYTNQQVIDDIIAVANGAESLSQDEYEAHGTIGLTTVRNHFCTWNKAVKAAGLQPIETGVHHSKHMISDEVLLEEIIRLKQELGKRPTENEVNAKGKFSVKPYRDRWKSLKIAYEKAIELYPEDAEQR